MLSSGRRSASFTTESNGMGMGLSICRSIIEIHGGRFRAVPNVPRGARLRLRLALQTRIEGDGAPRASTGSSISIMPRVPTPSGIPGNILRSVWSAEDSIHSLATPEKRL